MTPPREVVAALQRYDPDLRLRWGVRTALWIIERRMPERHKDLLAERPNPWKSPKGFDLYDGWKEGYVHVLSVHPSLLDARVFDALREADAWRQGGFEGLNRKLNDAEAQWEAEKDRAIQNWNEGAAREAHDRLAWLQGRRVPVPDQVTDGPSQSAE